jgi:hypothetical protein
MRDKNKKNQIKNVSLQVHLNEKYENILHQILIKNGKESYKI